MDLLFNAKDIVYILTFAGGLLTLWWRVNGRIASSAEEKTRLKLAVEENTRRVEKLESEADESRECQVEIKLALKTIQADIAHIKEQLKKGE